MALANTSYTLRGFSDVSPGVRHASFCSARFIHFGGSPSGSLTTGSLRSLNRFGSLIVRPVAFALANGVRARGIVESFNNGISGDVSNAAARVKRLVGFKGVKHSRELMPPWVSGTFLPRLRLLWLAREAFMNHDRHRATLAIFAAVLAIAIVLAFVTTLREVDTRAADNTAPPGTIGLAKPHQPLDVRPGRALPPQTAH